MTIRELMEQAHLDALGLLDPAEQAAFERAFAAAPPALKSQVREEQARIAGAETLLPDVEPSPDLRDRVLAAVSAAMVGESAAQDALGFAPSRRVSTWWRTSSVALLSACLILSAAFVTVYSSNRALESRLAADREVDALNSATASSRHLRDMLFHTETRRVIFTRAATAPSDFTGEAAIYTNPGWDSGRAYFSGLRATGAGEVYRLVVLTGADAIGDTIHEFTSNQALNSFQIRRLEAGVRVALVSVRGESAVVLLTATV
jgi:hypothetical protein